METERTKQQAWDEWLSYPCNKHSVASKEVPATTELYICRRCDSILDSDGLEGGFGEYWTICCTSDDYGYVDDLDE